MIDPNLPIDKIAALVVSRSADKGVDHKQTQLISSMTPLPIGPFTGPRKDDLTGRKSGRFTVIGPALWKPKNHLTSTNSQRWVVRCSCGRYQMLTTKAVKKNSPQTACVECKPMAEKMAKPIIQKP